MMMFGDKEETNAVGGPAKRSLLDGLITGLFGHDRDQMTPEDAAADEKKQAKSQKEASAMAVAGATNPGGMADAAMEPPVVGGSKDLLQTIGQIVKFFSAGGGGG